MGFHHHIENAHACSDMYHMDQKPRLLQVGMTQNF